MNRLINDSLETKNRLSGDLTSSNSMLEGFTGQLNKIEDLSPQFLANPIVINKKPVYTASTLEIVTPMALVLVLLLTTLLITGVSFVVERNEGAYSRLMLSSTGKFELFLGKVLGQLAFAILESSIILLAAIVVFGVRVGGTTFSPENLTSILSVQYFLSLAEIIAGLAIVSFAFISLGLLVSNYTKIQSTTILAGLLIVIPMIFISGLLIPVELMSPQIQGISSFQPLSLGILIISEIINKGTHLVFLAKEIIMLLVPAMIFFIVTLLNRNI